MPSCWPGICHPPQQQKRGRDKQLPKGNAPHPLHFIRSLLHNYPTIVKGHASEPSAMSWHHKTNAATYACSKPIYPKSTASISSIILGCVGLSKTGLLVTISPHNCLPHTSDNPAQQNTDLLACCANWLLSKGMIYLDSTCSSNSTTPFKVHRDTHHLECPANKQLQYVHWSATQCSHLHCSVRNNYLVLSFWIFPQPAAHGLQCFASSLVVWATSTAQQSTLRRRLVQT